MRLLVFIFPFISMIAVAFDDVRCEQFSQIKAVREKVVKGKYAPADYGKLLDQHSKQCFEQQCINIQLRELAVKVSEIEHHALARNKDQIVADSKKQLTTTALNSILEQATPFLELGEEKKLEGVLSCSKKQYNLIPPPVKKLSPELKSNMKNILRLQSIKDALVFNALMDFHSDELATNMKKGLEVESILRRDDYGKSRAGDRDNTRITVRFDKIKEHALDKKEAAKLDFVQNHPLLFQSNMITNNFDGHPFLKNIKKISEESFGSDFQKIITQLKNEIKSKNGDPSSAFQNINSVLASNNNGTNLLSKLLGNNEIKDNFNESIGKHAERINSAGTKICNNDGEALQHMPNLLSTIENKIMQSNSDPVKAKQELLQTQYAWCTLREKFPLNDTNWKYMIGGGVLVVGGIAVNAVPIAGQAASPVLLAAGSGLLTYEGGRQTVKSIANYTEAHQLFWLKLTDKDSLKEMYGTAVLNTVMTIPDIITLGLSGVKTVRIASSALKEVRQGTRTVRQVTRDIVLGDRRLATTVASNLNIPKGHPNSELITETLQTTKELDQYLLTHADLKKSIEDLIAVSTDAKDSYAVSNILHKLDTHLLLSKTAETAEEQALQLQKAEGLAKKINETLAGVCKK